MKQPRSSNQTILLLSTAVVLALSIALLLAIVPVSAQVSPADPLRHDSLSSLIPLGDSVNPPVNNGCMEDVYFAGGGQGGGLNCTANDVGIADIINVVVTDDGCAFPGDSVTFEAEYKIELTAQERYDIGLYVATDGDPNGDGALTGQCTIATLPYAPNPPWVDLDGLVGDTQDTCGDIDDDHNPLYPKVTVTAVCVDTDGDGYLNVSACTSWRQPGANDLCTSPTDAFPGAPSKCKCDEGLDIPIKLENPGKIIVDKATVPAGSDQSFVFALTGAPTDTAHPGVNTPFSLTDAAAPFDSGNLYAGTYHVTETVADGWTLAASCTSDKATPNDPADDVTFDYANGADLPLAEGETISCVFTNTEEPKTGNIIIKKVTARPGASTLFPFDPSWSDENFSLREGGEQDSGPLPAGEYIVTELVPGYWKLTGLVCVDPDDGSTVDLASGMATVDLDADETVTCTFTNEKYGRIVIAKSVSLKSKSWDPNTQFEFDPSWSDENVYLKNGERFDTSYTLWPGVYSIAELNLPPGWTLLQASCNDGSPINAIDLSTGETVTCRFLNLKK